MFTPLVPWTHEVHQNAVSDMKKSGYLRRRSSIFANCAISMSINLQDMGDILKKTMGLVRC